MTIRQAIWFYVIGFMAWTVSILYVGFGILFKCGYDNCEEVIEDFSNRYEGHWYEFFDFIGLRITALRCIIQITIETMAWPYSVIRMWVCYYKAIKQFEQQKERS